VAEWESARRGAQSIGRQDLANRAQARINLLNTAPPAPPAAPPTPTGQPPAAQPPPAAAPQQTPGAGALPGGGPPAGQAGQAPGGPIPPGQQPPLPAGGAGGAGQAGPRERVTIRFEDGSTVEIGPNGSFILEDARGESLLQTAGRLFHDIKSGKRFRSRVEVRGQSVAVAVRGTQFAIELSEDERSFTVEVVEGTVEGTSGGKTVEVGAGRSVTVRPGEPPVGAGARAAVAAAAGGCGDAPWLRVALLASIAAFLFVGGGLVAVRVRARRAAR